MISVVDCLPRMITWNSIVICDKENKGIASWCSTSCTEYEFKY